MKKALYISERTNDVYSPTVQRGIAELVDVYRPPLSSVEIVLNRSVLNDVQILLTTWHGPKLDESFMRAAPKLEAVFHAAGSVRPIVTDAFWDRDAPICSAWEANAIPVAEFTLSQILYGIKQGYHSTRAYREQRKLSYPYHHVKGVSGSKVGVISLGTIGRMVVEHLSHLNIEILAYDPFVDQTEADRLGVKMVSMDEIFQKCDVVSLHTPWLKETENMIRGHHFTSMRANTTFINTARGALVHEAEMIQVLKKRQDIFAVLDVTWPEPPARNSVLWDLSNVVLTPHIAGSVGTECFQMGQYMYEELQRYLNNQTLKYSLTRQRAVVMA